MNMFQPWSISAQIVAKYLKSDPNNGLTGAEAQNRLKKYGANRIPAKKKFSGVKYIVFVCAAISIVSGGSAD
jgi:magnesium-transporting ATPase (P-type)